VGKDEVRSQKGGVDAVSVVAFAYDSYTNPSKNNGVLRATLTEPESSGILKKFRGRCDVARLKAVGSRSGFRYGGVSASRPPGGGFVGGTPTLLEGRAFKMILLSMILPYSR